MSLNTHKFYRILKYLNNEILALREQQITFKEELHRVHTDVADLDIRIGIFFEEQEESYRNEIADLEDRIYDLEWDNSSSSSSYDSSREVSRYRDLYNSTNEELTRTTEELDGWKEKYGYLEEDDDDDYD